jgi:hypothetical protein
MAKLTTGEFLLREFHRGFARKGGFSIYRHAEKQIRNWVYDPNSKFRKKMNSLTINSTLKSSLRKFYEIIDLFYEEYKQESTLLQKSIYCKSDIKRIERKLTHIKRLVRNDDDQFLYDDLIVFWNEIKKEVL